MFPSAAPPPSKSPKKPSFGKPEKPSLVSRLLPWLLVAVGVAAIAIMVIKNPPQKQLVCHNVAGGNSLTAMGTCTEE